MIAFRSRSRQHFIETLHYSFYGQVLSLFALYGRPFKQRVPYRLAVDIVPTSMRSIHDATITLRDKIFAHIDQDKDAVRDDSGDLLGKMIILRTKKAFLCTMSTIVPAADGVEEILAATKCIRLACQTELQRVWKMYPGAIESFGDGAYEINIVDLNEAPMMRKLNWPEDN